MRRIIAAVVLCCLLLTSACRQSAAPVEVTPPFWVVCDSETGGRVYLLGSMHAGKRGTVYPQHILDAFADSDVVACEVDTVAFSADKKLVSECVELMKCADGTTARDYFGESYAEVKNFFRENGIYGANYEDYIPAMWSSLLSSEAAKQCGLSAEYGTESIMLDLAHRQGRRIEEIETARGQYEMSAAAPMSVQVYFLTQAAQSGIEAQLDEMERLYAAWSSFDEAALKQLIEVTLPDEIAEDYTTYYNAMYTDRQQVMAEYVLEKLRGGEQVFMLVGAMHFYAEPDILDIVSGAGYEIVKRSAEQQEVYYVE